MCGGLSPLCSCPSPPCSSLSLCAAVLPLRAAVAAHTAILLLHAGIVPFRIEFVFLRTGIVPLHDGNHFFQGSETVTHSGDYYYYFCFVHPISFWIHVIDVYAACAITDGAVLGTHSVRTGYFSDMISQDVLLSNSENTTGTVLQFFICWRCCFQ